MEIVFYFCVYSVFGWALDTSHRSFQAKRYKPGGFSRWPFSPIYGFGGLGIVALAPAVADWPLWLAWLFFAVILAAYEYVSGALTHRAFGRRLWNYSKDKYDLHGHTGPGYAAVWGILALFTIHFMHPFLERFYHAMTS